MPVHYYHLTDGRDLVLDRVGRRTRTKRDVTLNAAMAAGRLMKGIPGAVDWSEWLVSVQNDRGSMVAVVPFPASRA